jgi:hypothetical protein
MYTPRLDFQPYYAAQLFCGHRTPCSTHTGKMKKAVVWRKFRVCGFSMEGGKLLICHSKGLLGMQEDEFINWMVLECTMDSLFYLTRIRVRVG